MYTSDLDIRADKSIHGKLVSIFNDIYLVILAKLEDVIPHLQ